MLFDHIPPVWLLFVVTLVAYVMHNKYGHGIVKIPGPFLAAYTDLWRFLLVSGDRPELSHIRLHQKFGPLVRLGPNSVSVADPEAIKLIYGLATGYIKSGFYPVQQQAGSKDGHLLQGLFSATDEKYHAKLRRAVNNAYAMSTLVQFEPLVDSTTTEFLKQLSERYADKPNKICDFGQWLQFYAFDVIGELTFSKRLGFVDRGVDVDNIIGNLEKALNYFATVGQIPILDKLLLKNPVRIWLSRIGIINATSPVAIFAKSRMSNRLARLDGKEQQGIRGSEVSRRDFLSRFLEAGEKDPDFMTPQRVLSLTSANVFAGSDTTAISLRAIFYYLLKNQEKLQKLRNDLETADREGLFSDRKLVRWTEANEIPYLGAVIKEALRIHPAAGLPLERIVPRGGATICGNYIPEGTIVGCSAWLIHRNQRIFGEDIDTFRPERWLEDKNRASLMNQYLFSFGAGSRTCAGKNVSYLEMFKLVPAILRTFDIELADPDREWTLKNKWFVKQSNFHGKNLDYEGELAVVLGKTGKDILRDDALSYVAGYLSSNDVSARTWQRDPAFAGGVPQWSFAKSFDTFAPLLPMLVAPGVVGTADNLRLQTIVNGEVRQDSNANGLLFDVAALISFLSQGSILKKGTVIMTGTPDGVILGLADPKPWLKDGDVVEVKIEHLGSCVNKVVYELEGDAMTSLAWAAL